MTAGCGWFVSRVAEIAGYKDPWQNIRCHLAFLNAALSHQGYIVFMLKSAAHKIFSANMKILAQKFSCSAVLSKKKKKKKNRKEENAIFSNLRFISRTNIMLSWKTTESHTKKKKKNNNKKNNMKQVLLPRSLVSPLVMKVLWFYFLNIISVPI